MSERLDRTLLRGALAGAMLACFPGCVRRTIEITSTPPDALVWINSYEVGRTPVTFEFTYDGVYDIRLRLDGYKPLVTSASTDPPVWDLPGVDFLAEIMPVEFDRSVKWHFDLEQTTIDPAARIDRAEAMRASLRAWDEQAAAQARSKGAEETAGKDETSTSTSPTIPFGTPSLPPDTAPGEAPVRPPELYPPGGGIQPDE